MGLAASVLLEAILGGARNPMFVLSREGTVIEANRAALRWMELRREAVVGRVLWNLPPFNALAEPLDGLAERLDGLAEAPGEREFEIQHYVFSVRPAPVDQATGAEVLIAEGADLSRNEAERQRARMAFETANMGVWTWDLTTNKVNNQSDRGVFGFPAMVNASREEAVTRVHPDDREFLLEEADAAVASRSGFRVEVRGVLGTGEIKWLAVTGTVRCNEAGEPVRVEGISVDITERKETELRLRESEARFKSIFEQAGIGIALVSPDGLPLEANPALTQLLGYTAEELQKMHFSQRCDTRSQFTQPIWETWWCPPFGTRPGSRCLGLAWWRTSPNGSAWSSGVFS